ncbi:hypothetical protein F5Y19DRAFT_472691 [Xylariaceae sp. FL1651]|nr:hypothetical protein F5Y19DRAFT_472691 [Xylariaceae sp. FL1651]
MSSTTAGNLAPPYSELIIGLDFGTTHTGVVWAHTMKPESLHEITNWPTDSASSSSASLRKVPTKIQYLTNGDFEWGARVATGTNSAGVHTLFKLALEPKKYEEAAGAIGAELNLENVDQIITDYLTGVFGHLLRTVEKNLSRNVVEKAAIHVVLTVPAIWSDRAKQRTLQAFKGIPNLPAHTTTSLLSEPEAAAISALHELQKLDRHKLSIGDAFVVVDAGGGTVDLITYSITSLSPILEVREATEGTGGVCGSTLVNSRFARFLTTKLEKENGWNNEVLSNALIRFEDKVKKRFALNDITQNTTYNIEVRGMAANRDAGMTRDGRFSFSATDLHMFFEPDILKIIQLVKEQIRLCDSPIRSILLVGGYGASNYLRERLSLAFEEDQAIQRRIEILQPSNAWTAVARGAAMKGLARAKPENYDIPAVMSRTARKHYGTVCGVEYDGTRHATLFHKRYWDGLHGCWRVHAMKWFITRGERVSEDIVFPKRYYWAWPVGSLRSRSFSVSIYADETSSVAPIECTDSVQLLCHLTADLSSIPDSQLNRETGKDGKEYYCVNVEIESVYRSASTEYSLIHKGKRYDTVTAEYV